MAIKVLVVDDSSFFRRRVSEIINADPRLEVIDVAVNGLDAVEKTKKLKPDVITMDVEMPVMNGIVAVKEIMASVPTPILMFSSLTHEGAKATFDALDAGAVDFLPKKFEDISLNRDEATQVLQQRVLHIGLRRIRRPIRTQSSIATSSLSSNRDRDSAPSSFRPVGSKLSSGVTSTFVNRFKASGKQYQLTAIGTSTGGPVALQRILTALPINYPTPIILVQHMPATFTAAFAARLNSLCQIEVKEAADGDRLQAGVAYLAPGGKQMVIEGGVSNAKLRIIDGPAEMSYKPSVDISFASAAKVYSGNVLSMILTGMGADGREGSRLLKESGATCWAQDEESCVVYGMPQAVAKAGISTEDLPLDRIAERMLIEFGLT